VDSQFRELASLADMPRNDVETRSVSNATRIVWRCSRRMNTQKT
jgi:hypothetical protein